MYVYFLLRSPQFIWHSVPCWDSLLLPTAVSVLPGNYVPMLPRLFLQLYYNGFGFQSSLLQVWAKAQQVRVHTGLLTMERSRCRTQLELKQFMFAPENSRPLGVSLPHTPTLCGCQDLSSRWKPVYRRDKFGEQFIFLRSSCCQTELYVAIFRAHCQTLKRHGTTIAVEVWDEDAGCFPFDWSRLVKMTASVSAILLLLRKVPY